MCFRVIFLSQYDDITDTKNDDVMSLWNIIIYIYTRRTRNVVIAEQPLSIGLFMSSWHCRHSINQLSIANAHRTNWFRSLETTLRGRRNNNNIWAQLERVINIYPVAYCSVPSYLYIILVVICNVCITPIMRTTITYTVSTAAV